MSVSDKNEIFMSAAPHISSSVTTKKLMSSVVISLLPVAAYGVYVFGSSALIRLVVAVISCVGFETLFRYLTKQDIRITDYSAVITGLLLGMVVTPNLPIWMLIIGSFFAIVVGKEFFGGLGANVFNPALVGRAFMVVSFSVPMGSWVQPKGSIFNAIGSATPLTLIKMSDGAVLSSSEILGKLNVSSMNDVYKELFFGLHGGCIGETGILLILAGFVYLLVTKVIDCKITVSMVVTTVAITSIAGIDPFLTLMSGGLLFGAVFMATDYVTTPVTSKGKIVFGVGCGLITALLRIFSGLPEGVMYSILIMNAIVPFLNRLIPKKYGFVKPVKK